MSEFLKNELLYIQLLYWDDGIDTHAFTDFVTNVPTIAH